MPQSVPYGRMAEYYDMIYHRLVDYEGDCDFIEQIFRKHAKTRVRSVLDIGCGTGNHALILAKRRYQVTGIDRSKEMLVVAQQKAGPDSTNPSFRRMDMRMFNLKAKYHAALVLFGGFGYMLKEPELVSFFTSVRKHLARGGMLLYEFWQDSGVDPAGLTPGGRRNWVNVEDSRTRRRIIRLDKSTYDRLNGLLTMHLDHFVIDLKENRLLDEFKETHTLRTYSLTEMTHLLKENGLRREAYYVWERKKTVLKPPVPQTYRVACVARAL